MAKIYFDNHSLDLARAKIFNSLASEEQVNLFDVIELSSGDYLPKSKMEDGRYKVYGGGGLTQSTHTTSNVDFQTIGIGRVGARCGCVFGIEKKSWVTDNALFVSNFKKKYDLSFLIHYLNHINLNQFANQSAQPVISQRGIARCTIPDVEFYKQQQIGEILDAIESEEDFEDIFYLKSVLEFERNLSLLNTELDQQQTYLQLLRQTILQEAVQGKLTRQDPTDEPATELLKRIKTEKEKLNSSGASARSKKEKELPPITEDDIPFKLPEGWAWCRLGELINEFLGGFAFKSFDLKKEGKSQVLRLGNVKNDKALLTANPVYIDDKVADLASSNELLIDDILITMTGTRLKRDYCFTVLLKEGDFDGKRLFLNQRVGCLRMSKSLNVNFINIALKADNILDDIFKDETGTANQGNLGVTTIKSCLFPLPPLTEQQRIVAKVQQLQQQLSELETQAQQSRQYTQQLLQSVLKEAFEQKAKVYEMVEEESK